MIEFLYGTMIDVWIRDKDEAVKSA